MINTRLGVAEVESVIKVERSIGSSKP